MTPPAPEPKSTELKDASCYLCGTSNQKRVLISCVTQGQQKWVCVRCLPMVIHSTE